MRQVKIIQGTYGLLKNNMVVPKTSADAPFLLEEEAAEKIVNLGIAVYTEEELKEESSELEEMDLQELKRLAKEMGIKPVGTKMELIEKIKEENAPELEAIDPE